VLTTLLLQKIRTIWEKTSKIAPPSGKNAKTLKQRNLKQKSSKLGQMLLLRC